MKGRIEASHLKQVRLTGPQQADRGEVVRLVQRRERDQSLQPLDGLGGRAYWRGVVETPVNYAMAYGREPVVARLLSQKTGQERNGCIMAEGFSRCPSPFADDGACCALGPELRGRIEPLDLPSQEEIKCFVPRHKQRKLDARRTCVDYQNRVTHRCRPSGASRRTAAEETVTAKSARLGLRRTPGNRPDRRAGARPTYCEPHYNEHLSYGISSEILVPER
jgi:hypothetical protein